MQPSICRHKKASHLLDFCFLAQKMGGDSFCFAAQKTGGSSLRADGRLTLHVDGRLALPPYARSVCTSSSVWKSSSTATQPQPQPAAAFA